MKKGRVCSHDQSLPCRVNALRIPQTKRFGSIAGRRLTGADSDEGYGRTGSRAAACGFDQSTVELPFNSACSTADIREDPDPSLSGHPQA